MFQPGVYPASVTPFNEKGQIDMAAMARLLAWFEAAGCKGAVLAGTNGEGPSLSATEKRDLIRDAMPLRGKLDIVLGIATSSLEEAVWSCNQAERAGAIGALVMPPSYFREASEDGIVHWFLSLLDRTGIPILVYNFPQRTGVTLTGATLARLAEVEGFAGAKDSSGARENLAAYASALDGGGKALYVGNETLLIEALEAGWTGTISGAANVMPYPLVQVVGDWVGGKQESARAKHQLALPAIEALRRQAQPATNKALLENVGVLPSSAVRLPLSSLASADVGGLRDELERHMGPLDAHGRITA